MKHKAGTSPGGESCNRVGEKSKGSNCCPTVMLFSDLYSLPKLLTVSSLYVCSVVQIWPRRECYTIFWKTPVVTGTLYLWTYWIFTTHEKDTRVPLTGKKAPPEGGGTYSRSRNLLEVTHKPMAGLLIYTSPCLQLRNRIPSTVKQSPFMT